MSWNDITSADLYFVTRFGADWASVSTINKTALLQTAYNRINNNPDFTIPTTPDATQLVTLKLAENELAWYMNIHLEDEDRRKGIQAQGVTEAGIVKEKYADLAGLPIPPFVLAILDSFVNNAQVFYAADLTRDEDSSVNK